MPALVLALLAFLFAGNIVQKTAPNGDTEAYSYDALNRAGIESAQTGAAVPLFDFLYAYDLVGNVTSIAETYPGGLNNRTVTNTYDNINRLLVEAVITNAYDPLNRLLTQARDMNGNPCTPPSGFAESLSFSLPKCFKSGYAYPFDTPRSAGMI